MVSLGTSYNASSTINYVLMASSDTATVRLLHCFCCCKIGYRCRPSFLLALGLLLMLTWLPRSSHLAGFRLQSIAWLLRSLLSVGSRLALGRVTQMTGIHCFIIGCNVFLSGVHLPQRNKIYQCLITTLSTLCRNVILDSELALLCNTPEREIN